MKLMILLALLLSLVLGLRLLIPRMGSSVAGGIVEHDGRQTLAECPDTPNCQQDTLDILRAPENAIRTMADLLTKQAGTRLITQTDRYLHVNWSTRLLGFVDDVEFLLAQSTDDDRPILQVRSASRLGKSDLGANAKRIEEIRSASQGRL